MAHAPLPVTATAVSSWRTLDAGAQLIDIRAHPAGRAGWAEASATSSPEKREVFPLAILASTDDLLARIAANPNGTQEDAQVRWDPHTSSQMQNLCA